MHLSIILNILSALTWSQNQTAAPDAGGIAGPEYSFDGTNEIPHSILPDFVIEFAPLGSSDEKPVEELRDAEHVPFIDLTPVDRGQLIHVNDPLTDMRLMNEAQNADSGEPVEVESPFIDLTQVIKNQTQQPEDPFPLSRLLASLISGLGSRDGDDHPVSTETDSAETKTPTDVDVPLKRLSSEGPDEDDDDADEDMEKGPAKFTKPALVLIAEKSPNGTITFRHPKDHMLIDSETKTALAASSDPKPSSTPAGSGTTAVAAQSPTDEGTSATDRDNLARSSLQEAHLA